ncbi:Pectinesterase ppme1 [Thalictrum thalictroides]|uniref:Pectinesterase n=1 Tax=Thalictrum thalictroides TaxID=46969 RepID=A0A7J6UX19_THATH|nr:Pectinesterase ppme1 [Thalictrum thalictroides]
MIGKLTYMAAQATFLTTILILIIPNVIADTKAEENSAYITMPVHLSNEFSTVPAGLQAADSSLTSQLISVPGGIDPPLAEAEKAPKIIKVSQDGSGEFKTITDAVKSIPSGNKVRTIIAIGPGEYKEKVHVDRFKPFVTFYGTQPGNMPKIVYGDTAKKLGTFNSATVIVESDYFVAVNIIFANSAPLPIGKELTGEQAVAMRISGNKAAFHNCRFIGFQDTLCDDKGLHFFNNSYVEGTVDFVFGTGKSLYLKSELRSVAKGFAAVAAQGRQSESEDNGFTFVSCNLTGTGDIYLARTWKARAKIVFAYTYLGNNINPAGWFNNKASLSNETVFYGEYKCIGPGASNGKRALAKMLTDAEAKPYLDKTYINGDTWLLPIPKI